MHEKLIAAARERLETGLAQRKLAEALPAVSHNVVGAVTCAAAEVEHQA